MNKEDSNNYLYLGRRINGQVGYVGIGGVSRPYGNHNQAADEVLREGEVWMTESPFSTRQDAEMAESLLVRALTWASEIKPDLTNIAKIEYSKYLIPALPFKEGKLKYSEISNALFVKIKLGSLKGRTAPSGDAGDLELALRCNRWWGLGRSAQRNDDVKYLIAVSSGAKPSRIIGVWRTRPVSDWWLENQKDPNSPSRTDDHPWNNGIPVRGEHPAKGWVATLESNDPNVNDWQGMEIDWEGYASQGVGYSRDIIASWNK